ncbi:hypothetical protein [Acrocarpospora corrugata]|nr:hypothetical protein [Acrocarpospora corrugata]
MAAIPTPAQAASNSYVQVRYERVANSNPREYWVIIEGRFATTLALAQAYINGNYNVSWSLTGEDFGLDHVIPKAAGDVPRRKVYATSFGLAFSTEQRVSSANLMEDGPTDIAEVYATVGLYKPNGKKAMGLKSSTTKRIF